MKPPLRPLVAATAFALLAGVLVTPQLVGAVLPHPWRQDPIEVSLSLALLALFGAAALSGRRLSTRAGADAVIVALATAVGVLIASVAALWVNITYGSSHEAIGLWGLYSAVLSTSPAVTLLPVLLLPIIAATMARSLPPASWLRGARFGAYAASLALVGLLGAATVVSQRAPSRMQYLTSLPMFARLPAQTQLGSRSNASETDRRRDVIPLGDVTLVRDCSGRLGAVEAWCSLGVVRSVHRGALSTATLDAAPKSTAYIRHSDELRVRLDGARDLLVVNDRVALDLRALRPRNVGPWNLVPVLAPPRAWITFAATGLLLSLALLVATRRRRAAEPVGATLRPDGALVLDGRALTGVAVPPNVAPGPVVVFLARGLVALHYRDDAPQSGARVEAGTLADHRARVTARASMWAAVAWATAALAGAPLAAWAHGAVTALATTRPAALPALPALPAAYEIEGVRVEALRAGRGEVLRAGQTVDVHYTGSLLDGTVFDASWERSAPFTFPYGGGRVIPGFERGMRGMRVGERRRVTIPPELAYGDRPIGSTIPPGSTLVFEIELLAVR